MEFTFSLFAEGQPHPTVVVVSHERSGTHFLINSLGKAFGYLHDDWVDLDWHAVPINYFSAQNLQNFWAQLRDRRIANPFKSHHEAEIMRPAIEQLMEAAVVLYVYREPWAVMQSVQRLFNRYTWHEGPCRESPSALMRAQPEGHMMRYQMSQYPSLLHRWHNHVSGWMDLAERYPGITPVRYESLRDDYAGQIAELGRSVIGLEPHDLTPPERTQDVVAPRRPEDHDVAPGSEDRAFIEEVAGDLLARLGYARL